MNFQTVQQQLTCTKSNTSSYAKGVVGKFVEFFGPGVAEMPLADRATIANMAPEYGATCGFFPVDEEALDYMRLTGREEEQIQVVKEYCKANGYILYSDNEDPIIQKLLKLILSIIEANLSGPKRPQDLIPLTEMKVSSKSSCCSRRKPRIRITSRRI